MDIISCSVVVVVFFAFLCFLLFLLLTPALVNHHSCTQTTTTVTTTTTSPTITDDPIYVYLASDNEVVKEDFIRRLENNNPDLCKRIKIMRVETKFIYHVKNLALFKSATDNEGLLDLVFDWYALSLANSVYAWRKGSTSMVC